MQQALHLPIGKKERTNEKRRKKRVGKARERVIPWILVRNQNILGFKLKVKFQMLAALRDWVIEFTTLM